MTLGKTSELSNVPCISNLDGLADDVWKPPQILVGAGLDIGVPLARYLLHCPHHYNKKTGIQTQETQRVSS